MSNKEKLNEVINDMENGNINPDNINLMTLCTLKEIILSQNVKSGSDVFKLEKANLVAVVDSIATLLFYPEWTPNDTEIK